MRGIDIKSKTTKFLSFIKGNENFYVADLYLSEGERTLSHNHDFYEFFVVISGDFLEVCNGEHATLTRKSTHVLRPEDEHQLIATGKNKKNILRNIAIRKTHFERILKSVGLYNTEMIFDYFFLNEAVYMHFISKTNSLFSHSGNLSVREFIFNSILNDILIFGLLQGDCNQSTPAWLVSAYRDIRLNRNYIYGIEKFFELTGRTQEHVTRVFKRYYNITPTEYINSLRLTDAGNQLISSDKPIIQIAFDCGFNNISYFNRLFKNYYQISPKDFRNRSCEFF